MKYSLSNDTWKEEELEAACEVIYSRNFSMGEKVKEYEKCFAAYFGAKFAVMSNSGSSANLLAIAALVYSGQLHCGDEVLVTAVSWSTTYFPLYQMGLKIRFVDIDRDTLNVCPKKMRAALTPLTRAVMAVNLLGNPNDYETISGFCKEYGLILLEDNCESMGASYRGQKTGTFGVIGTFSTYFSHHLCTMEGGMSLTDNEELYHYMLSIRSHGWTRHLPDESLIYKKAEDPFYESFNFIMPGYNVRPLEIEAAVGLEQLKKLDDFIAQRKKNAAYLATKLVKTEFRMQKETDDSSWFGFAIILPEKAKGNRKKYTDVLMKAGIEVRPVVAGNFARQKALNYMQYSISGQLENADYVHENAFFVGNHSVEMERQIDYLVETLNSVAL